MDTVTRRQMLGTTAAGLVTAVAGAGAATMTPATEPAVPEPHRGVDGANILGPTNPAMQRQNPDLLSPPKTDRGKVTNLHWSFTDSHMKLEPGGWSRETTIRELPVSTAMAGVNMRLKRGAFRELHWHTTAEWSFMIKGNARITAVDEDGRLFVDDVTEGDLWFFPAGVPHSIQGLDSDYPEGGCEFLLVFDDGSFSEDSTFLLTDLMNHFPMEVVAADLGTTPDQLAAMPKKELFIYPCAMPAPLEQERANKGAKPVPMSFKGSMFTGKKPLFESAAGKVFISDVRSFPASKGLIAAHVEVAPGAFRELHWHTSNGDEWQYYLSGFGRMTVFTSGGAARTFNFQAGDVGYVPKAMPHYIQNLGSEPMRFLEVFKAEVYKDVSLRQWLSLTPPTLVQGHLNVTKELLAKLPTTKESVMKM